MNGKTTHEATRLPGSPAGLNQLETYEGHQIDPTQFEYRDMPIADKAAGEFGNPSLVENNEVYGWKIVGPSSDGHPKERLCARRLDNPHSVRERQEVERKRQQTDPMTGNAIKEAIAHGVGVTKSAGITLDQLMQDQPTEAELARRAANAEALRSNPQVERMIENAGLDLSSLESEI